MFVNFKKGLIGIAAIGALSLGATQAQADNIFGILMNSGANIKVGNVFENTVTDPGDPLSGYGEVQSVNGNNDFCAGGTNTCELTFTFGGYTVAKIGPSEVIFTGGWVNFYVDTTPDFNPLEVPQVQNPTDASAMAAASDGTLWLTLAGHTTGYPSGLTPADIAGPPPINFGTLQGLGAILGSTIAGFGSGLLDVDDTGAANGNTAGAAGVANERFDTDTYADSIGGTADLTLDTSFTSNNTPYDSCAGGPGCLQGSATVNANIIPEPGTLSILGLGLLGLVAVRRRRRVA